MKIFGQIILVILSVGISLYAIQYFNFQPQHLLLSKGPLIDSPAYLFCFYLHVGGGAVALLVGPFQFFPKLRNRYLKLHRNLGKIYVLACLVGGLAGLIIAFLANGGPIAKIGFTFLALVWLYTTFQAYAAIRRKEIRQHQAWMIRSFALTFAAVTLRMEIPIYMIARLEFLDAYRLVSWTSWTLNLVVAEWIIQRQGIFKKAGPLA